jgi:hypothetical protein
MRGFDSPPGLTEGLPGWRNGIRKGLKIPGPKGCVGSTPTPGTKKLKSLPRANARQGRQRASHLDPSNFDTGFLQDGQTVGRIGTFRNDNCSDATPGECLGAHDA